MNHYLDYSANQRLSSLNVRSALSTILSPVPKFTASICVDFGALNHLFCVLVAMISALCMLPVCRTYFVLVLMLRLCEVW